MSDQLRRAVGVYYRESNGIRRVHFAWEQQLMGSHRRHIELEIDIGVVASDFVESIVHLRKQDRIRVLIGFVDLL